MASTNSYEKHYLTNRRPTNDDDKYVLVIFKGDNSFIIRKKSNLPGVDENGLVNIKDRGKIYIGYCLFEGSKAEIEAAAERLDKEMNTDLESDCEAVISISKTNTQRPQQISTIKTTPTTSLSKSNIETSGSSTTKPNNTQKKNDNNNTQPKIQSLASTNLDITSANSTNYQTPPPTNISVHNKRIRETSTKQSTNSACATMRQIDNMVENTKNVRSTRQMLTFDDDFSEGESDDDQSFESVIALDNSVPSTSTTNNRNNVRPSKRCLSKTLTTTPLEKTAKRLCKNLSSSKDCGDKEMIMLLKTLLLSIDDLTKDVDQSSKDIKNLVVSVDKIDSKLNILYENQKKMQRALTKRKINVSLNGSYFGDENASVDDPPFKSTLIYINSKGESIDLLQLYGVQTQMGRYVALVMDNLFTKEEITTITLDELLKDERYETIKEAVRSRVKLNHKMLDSEWATLHECILQKRRNEIRTRKSSAGNTNSTESVPQQTEEHFDEQNVSDTC